MARRTAGGILVTGAVLGLLALLPVAADAGAARPPGAVVAETPSSRTAVPATPADSGPLVLLLVSVGLGTMGVLSREPRPGGDQLR